MKSPVAPLPTPGRLSRKITIPHEHESLRRRDRLLTARSLSLSRREPLPTDVAIEIIFCGVCHSDLHQARDEWHNTVFPCVPGHEIVGRVTKAGSSVTKFKVGDLAAVGCMVDSCRTCPQCQRAPEHPLPVAAFPLLLGRRSFSGSGIGGIAETQKMLDFCADHGIACDIEMIGIQQVNEACDRLLKSDIKYRFVIDMASLKNAV